MICKFCGNEIDDSAEFCFICGQKVSDEAKVFVANGDDIYSQPEAEKKTAETVTQEPDFEETIPAQPYVAVTEPVVAPATPAPVAEPVQTPVKTEKIKGLGFKKCVCFLFAIIGLILYFSEKKKGNIDKANTLLNALMTGLCVKMGVAIIILGKKYLV